MITVLTGVNDFARGAELRRLIDAFVAEEGEFGLERIDAAEVDLGRLLESVLSVPFLADKRMIVLTNLAANKPLVEGIEQFLAAVADTTEVIIDEKKFDKRLNLYKVLKKQADMREFNELDERALAAWLAREAEARGGRLKPGDASYLVQRCGLDQLGLSNELDKLLAHNPEITRQMIDLLTEPLPQGSVFDLLDAAFSGNRKKTSDLYDNQRRQQVEPQAIMGMIAWQLHVLAVVKFNEKDGAEQIAKKAKLNPFVVRKTLNLTRNLTQAQVKDLVSRALKLDVRLKSEMIDADDAVQHFLLTI